MKLSEWERKAAQYEARAQVLRQLRDIVADDPTFAGDVRELLNGVPRDRPRLEPGAFDTPTPRRRRRRNSMAAKTQWDLILEHFKANENAWSTIYEISEALNLKPPSVGHLLFIKHQDQIEKRDHPNGGRSKQFRLAKGGT